MEEKELFQIGEVAHLYHISVGTLRHYEKVGLLAPEYTDPSSGYRYYSVKQFECLNTIRYLRALDMPLERIKLFLTNRDTEKLHKILLEQKEEVEKKRKELDLIERKIDTRIAKLTDAMESEIDQIAVRHISARRFAVLHTEIIPKDYLSLEYSIRELEEQAQENSVFLGKVGLGLTEDSLRRHCYNPYEIVFLLLDEEDYDTEKIIPVEAGDCVTVRFRGGHDQALVYYGRLMQYIEENQYEITGFSREITLIDYGFTDDVSQFVTEIQIPVRK